MNKKQKKKHGWIYLLLYKLINDLELILNCFVPHQNKSNLSVLLAMEFLRIKNKINGNGYFLSSI